MPCYKKHKIFFYYCRMSIKQGLNTELSDSDLAIGIYDKDLFQEYNFCYRVYEIKKAFKENEYICNQCFKLLQKVKDEISPKIHIIWNENAQYRVCTNIHRSLADYIFRKENVSDKNGNIPKESLSIYLNSSI